MRLSLVENIHCSNYFVVPQQYQTTVSFYILLRLPSNVPLQINMLSPQCLWQLNPRILKPIIRLLGKLEVRKVHARLRHPLRMRFVILVEYLSCCCPRLFQTHYIIQT